MGQRVGQTKFEFEINHWDRYVNQDLVLQKSPLHPSLEKYDRCTRKIFFLCYNDADQKETWVCIQIFTPDTPILSLLRIIEYDYDAPREKNKFGCFISYFLVLTGFTRSTYW